MPAIAAAAGEDEDDTENEEPAQGDNEDENAEDALLTTFDNLIMYDDGAFAPVALPTVRGSVTAVAGLRPDCSIS